MTSIRIYRGDHQIGGSAVELRTANSRLLIDVEAKLLNFIEDLQMEGVITGNPDSCGVLYTQQHGMRLRIIDRLNDAIPIYMSETTKELELMLTEREAEAHSISTEKRFESIKRVHTFESGKAISIGEFTVTPILFDNCAFDSCMLLIEAEGKKILYTGDFSLKGFEDKAETILKEYASDVNCVICRGTSFSRGKEHESLERHHMLKYKKVFVLCSPTDIDRIAGFIHENSDDRPVICDRFQKNILKFIEEKHGDKNPIYRFGELKCNYSHILHDDIEENGCLCFIRTNDWSKKILDDFREDTSIVYSLCDDYLKRDHPENKKIKELFSSGVVRNWWPYSKLYNHAYAEDLAGICDAVNPQVIIPVHPNDPEELAQLFPERTVTVPKEGEEVQI